jgi:hypothetical protein
VVHAGAALCAPAVLSRDNARRWASTGAGSPNDDWNVDTDRRTTGDVRVFGCGECPRVSTVSARGWMAYWVADPDEGRPAALLFLCPDCGRTELADE